MIVCKLIFIFFVVCIKLDVEEGELLIDFFMQRLIVGNLIYFIIIGLDLCQVVGFVSQFVLVLKKFYFDVV